MIVFMLSVSSHRLHHRLVTLDFLLFFLKIIVFRLQQFQGCLFFLTSAFYGLCFFFFVVRDFSDCFNIRDKCDLMCFKYFFANIAFLLGGVAIEWEKIANDRRVRCNRNG